MNNSNSNSSSSNNNSSSSMSAAQAGVDRYRVVVLGDGGVGKSALVLQVGWGLGENAFNWRSFFCSVF